MKNLFLILAVAFATACGGGGPLYFNMGANDGRDDMVQLGSTINMVGMTQISTIEIPVYYTYKVTSKNWMDQAYNPGAFGLVDYEDIVDAAILQGIIPTKLVEFDPRIASRDDKFILLIFDEKKLEKRKLSVLIVWNGKATTPFDIRLKKNESTVNKYCYFWWDIRTVIGDNFLQEKTTRVVNFNTW